MRISKWDYRGTNGESRLPASLLSFRSHFPTTDFLYYHKNDICNQELPGWHYTQLIIRADKRGSLRRFFYLWSKEVCNRERKTKTGESQLAIHNLKAPHERKQNYETIMKCPIAERMYFNILVVILASRWDLRAHFCFDIWPITKLLLICCVLPAKQYNLVWEQSIIHEIAGNNHPVVVPLVQKSHRGQCSAWSIWGWASYSRTEVSNPF